MQSPPFPSTNHLAPRCAISSIPQYKAPRYTIMTALTLRNSPFTVSSIWRSVERRTFKNILEKGNFTPLGNRTVIRLSCNLQYNLCTKWADHLNVTRLPRFDVGHKGPVIKAQVHRGCEVPNPNAKQSIYQSSRSSLSSDTAHNWTKCNVWQHCSNSIYILQLNFNSLSPPIHVKTYFCRLYIFFFWLRHSIFLCNVFCKIVLI